MPERESEYVKAVAMDYDSGIRTLRARTRGRSSASAVTCGNWSDVITGILSPRPRVAGGKVAWETSDGPIAMHRWTTVADAGCEPGTQRRIWAVRYERQSSHSGINTVGTAALDQARKQARSATNQQTCVREAGVGRWVGMEDGALDADEGV